MGSFVAYPVESVNEEDRYCLPEAEEKEIDPKQIFKLPHNLSICSESKTTELDHESDPDLENENKDEDKHLSDDNDDDEKDMNNLPSIKPIVASTESLWRPNADSMLELLLSGYCRDTDKHYKFPDDLMEMISEYLPHCDTWNKEYNKRDVLISEDGSIASLLKQNQHTIYGNQIIKYGDTYKWTMKIKSTLQKSECILIGLIKNDVNILKKYELNGYWGRKNRAPYDGYLFDGLITTVYPPKKGKLYGHPFGKENDIITMRLDKHSISYIVNGKTEREPAFDNIEKNEYRLAVCFVYAGSQLELL